MKRFLAVSVLFAVVVSGSYAEMTRLGSMRAKSMADMGAAASALAIMAEQPMMGMMAMGAMQQMAQQQFGEVDQTKPISFVLYSKAALPDFSTMDLQNDPLAMMAFATNIVYVAVVPVSLSAEEYLKGRGATDVVDGVARVNEESYVLCKDDYAIWSEDLEGVKQAGLDRATALTASLDTGVIEMVVEKVAIAKYAEFMEAMQKVETTDTEFTPLGEFASAFAAYQKAQMKTMRQLIGEMNKVVLGLNYDLTGGLTMDILLDVEKTGSIGKMLQTASVIDADAYALIPANSDFFMVSANVSDQASETKKMLQNALTTLVPAIKDADIRKSAETMIAEAQWIYENTGEVVAFFDRDKEGRMVMVSRLKSKDSAPYLAAKKVASDSMMNIISKYAPGQKFFTYDSASQRAVLDFEQMIAFVSEKVGEAPEADDTEKAMKAVDAVIGRKFEMSCHEQDGYTHQIGKAVGSDYAIPAATESSAIADRIKAIMPKGSPAKPMQVVSMSLGSIIKNFAPRVIASVGEEDEALAAVFGNLADASAGGITAAVWTENGQFREAINISVGELKGFVKFLTAMQQYEMSQFADAMEEFEEEEVESSDTNPAEATPAAAETDDGDAEEKAPAAL